MISKVINQFSEGYSKLTENGSCHHANGGSLVFCYNSSKNISRHECEEDCTSSSSCVGYQYALPHITKLDFNEDRLDRLEAIRDSESRYLEYRFPRCYLIPNSWNCPTDYYRLKTDKRITIAKTTSDIIPIDCRGHTHCNQCYAKNL